MNAILTALVNGFLLSVPIAAMVWLVLRVSRRGFNAATRYGIWWIVLLISMALPALFLPSKFAPAKPILKPAEVQATVQEDDDALPVSPLASPDRSASHGAADDRASNSPVAHARVARPVAPTPNLRTSSQQSAQQSPRQPTSAKTSIIPSLPIIIRMPAGAWTARTIKLLGAVWALASLLLLARLAVSFTLLWSRKKSADDAPARLQESIRRSLVACGVLRRVQIAVAKTGDSPIVAGPVRPSLLIPARLLAALDDAEMEQICLHEAAHLARYDDWSLLLQRTGEAVFVFHPVVRWIARQIDLEREIACDDFVISATGQPRRYASCLTHVAELAAGYSGSPLAAAVVDEGSHLTRRINTLLDKTRRAGTRILKAQLVAAVLALSLITWWACRSPALFALTPPQPAPQSVRASIPTAVFKTSKRPIAGPDPESFSFDADAVTSRTVLHYPLEVNQPEPQGVYGGQTSPIVGSESNMRQVQGIVPGEQNYVVLDEQIWAHARRDLADLRLFAGDQEVPYALTVLHGSTSGQRAETKLLNLGVVNGETQFDIDMMGNPEYDGVALRLAGSATNFVARAQVAGLDNLPGPPKDLGTSVLFDLSNEGFGSDFTLKFPTSAFRFLRVRLPQVTPEQILGAVAIDTHLYPSFWTPVSAELPIEQVGGTTVVTWEASEQVPVSRVVLSVDPSQTNFWRDIEVLTPSGGTVTNSSVRRVRVARGGNTAEAESLAIELPYEAWGGFKIVIENGDRPPLKISSAKGYFYERRMYFDPKTKEDVNLYYGNPRLVAPSYPYSRNFRPQENVATASLGLDMQNPEHSNVTTLRSSEDPRPPLTSSSQGRCSARDDAAILLPSDPAFADAQDLRPALKAHQFVVYCVLSSVSQRLFENQKGAALYRTSDGDFEVLFLGEPQSFASLEVIEQQQNGRYFYSFSGYSGRSPHMDSAKPMDFIKRETVSKVAGAPVAVRQLFVVWGDKQLAEKLRKEFNY